MASDTDEVIDERHSNGKKCKSNKRKKKLTVDLDVVVRILQFAVVSPLGDDPTYVHLATLLVTTLILLYCYQSQFLVSYS